MSFVYFKFLFINTIKRKPVWITWILFLFTCTCFIIILPLAAKMNTLQVWANTTMAICQTFMGMVAALFTSVLAINVFKDTNDDGTELIIISKPISRFKNVFTKFLLFGFFCLMVNISTVLLTSFTAFLPRTEIKFYVGLLVSMFIGNAVTFALFGSISILLTVKFVKVGVIVTNIIISLVFLIYQTLTLFVFSTPSVILDRNKMSASSYILHDRDTTTGEYKENEIVKFEPSSVEEGKEHPCQAKNWQEMVDFWENNIKAKDVTPILNATDLSGQIALTYMSYKTNEFAYRQANRLFALTRFYNYTLTTPASPEVLIDGQQNPNHIDWLYTGFNQYNAGTEDDPILLYVPSTIGFAAIKPLTTTRLRGYSDKIPVGTIKSKELLSAREVFFEPEEWQKYKDGFDALYGAIFDYRNYEMVEGYENYPEMWPSLFGLGDNLKKYYNIVWGCLTGHAGDADKPWSVDDEVYDDYQLSKYNATSFDIKNVNDLNDRFIQFKNYVYWKAIAEQGKILSGETYPGKDGQKYEETARTLAVGVLNDSYDSALGVTHTNNSWLMKSNSDDGFLDPNTQTLSLQLLDGAWRALYTMLDPTWGTDVNVFIDYLTHCAVAIQWKVTRLFRDVCDEYESYLYSSLEKSTRTPKYSGEMYCASDNWYPNIHGSLSEYFDIKIPVGQNMQYFFYKTEPTIKYWMFAVIWGSISLALFAGGMVVYNKYDIK